MSEAEARKDEGKELIEFATSTVRGPKKGVFQQLLGQHLILAVSSLSPKKERLVCEASMMLNEEQTKKAEIDRELIKNIHAVAMCFENAVSRRELTVIAWGFQHTKQNFERFIKSWLVSDNFDYVFRYKEEDSWGKTTIKTDLPPWILELRRQLDEGKITEKNLNEKHRHSLFFWASSSRLSKHGYANLLSQFCGWALPQIQIIYAKVSKFVNPNLYQDLLKTMFEAHAPQPSTVGVAT